MISRGGASVLHFIEVGFLACPVGSAEDQVTLSDRTSVLT